MAPGAPQVHVTGNVLRHVRINHGDPDATADVVVKGRYEVGMQDQAFLGPESGLAVPDGKGGVDLYIATQWLHVDLWQLCESLGLPQEKVRLIMSGVGGAFGGREDLSMQAHACMLALYTGRPREPHFARRRRNEWTSPDEMFGSFKDRLPFRAWDPAVLHDYCDYALVPGLDANGYVLACSPEIEASIYEASTLHDANINDRLGEIQAPVTVIRAPRFMPSQEGPMDMTASLTAPDLATRFQHGQDIVVPHSHFIPMEAPGLVAEHVNGLGTSERSRGQQH
jgi:hypothetical protein